MKRFMLWVPAGLIVICLSGLAACDKKNALPFPKTGDGPAKSKAAEPAAGADKGKPAGGHP